MESTLAAEVADADLVCVCRLFAGDRPEAVAYLLQRAQSPLQVPFHFLQLHRRGALSRAKPRKTTAADVETAYRAIFQRPPESDDVVQHHVAHSPEVDRLLASMLSSQEFVIRLPGLFARAFPASRKLWHVHIPKTGGSSFAKAAENSGWGLINMNVLVDIAAQVRDVAQAVHINSHPRGATLITGHWMLRQFLGSIGPFDQVVTFVRRPLEKIVSEFNYSVDVFRKAENVHRSDAAPLLERGLDPRSLEASYRNGYFGRNVNCAYLGNEATCSSAMHNLAACGGELAPVSAVASSIVRFFPNVPERRVNVSNQHVRVEDLSRGLREQILLDNEQDVLLHEVAELRLREGAELRVPEQPDVISVDFTRGRPSANGGQTADSKRREAA